MEIVCVRMFSYVSNLMIANEFYIKNPIVTP